MAEKIRLRIWLAGAAPFVIVLAAAGVLLLRPREKPPTARVVESAGDPMVQPTATDPPQQLPTSATSVALPPRPAAPPANVAMAAASASSITGPPPEPIPELDPLFLKPSGSGQWSPEQKTVFRQHVLHDLDARDRTLEHELAAARRSGDAATIERKVATLAYLRDHRAYIDRLMAAEQQRTVDAGQ